MKKVLVFILITVFFASCSSEPELELEVNINNNKSLINKTFVINQKIDGSTVYLDSFKIKKENFLIKIPYKGQGLINVSIPVSNINDIMMVAEEGVIQLNIEGTKPHFGGTPLNDRLQAYYQENDSISLLFQQIDKEYDLQDKAGQFTPKMKEELLLKRNQLLIDNTDRIIAFIKENVDNPVGEYYFMIHYITLTMERKLELIGFATERIKKEFGFQKTEGK